MIGISRKKFKSPILKNILKRPRLYEYLFDKRVVLVVAKAGQGKSTFVGDFICGERKSFLWYNFDETDSKLEIFVARFLHGLRETLKGDGIEVTIPDEVEDINISNGESVFKEFANIWQNTYSEGDFYIIFDNFHEIEKSKDVISFISDVIDEFPANVHIVILSRHYPPLSLSRVRSDKELAEITDIDLAFTEQELCALFLKTYKIDVDRSSIEQVSEVVRGWVTPVIYLMEKLQHKDSSGRVELISAFLQDMSLSELDDFFNSEVWGNLSKRIGEVLIKLSVVEDISPEIIEAISDENGITVLKELESKNLFIEPVDITRYLYRFHPLFRRYLEKKFKTLSSEDTRTVFYNVGEYFCEEENFECAIYFFTRSGDFLRAKSVFLKNVEELLRTGEYEKIKTMLSGFPKEMVLEDKNLAFYDAIASNLSKPFSTRDKLSELLTYFEKVRDYDKQAWIYSVLLTNYFFYQTGNEVVSEIVKKSEEFLKRVEDRLKPERLELLKALIPLGKWWIEPLRVEAFEVALRAEETSHKIRYTEAFLCSRLVLAKIYLTRGEFYEAENILKRTEKYFKSNEDFRLYRHYESLLSFYLGDTYFYMGRLNQAISEVQKAINNSSGEFAFLPYLKLNLVLYNLYLKDYKAAEQLCDTMETSSAGENLYLKYYLLYLLQMLIAYRNGNKRRVGYYAKRLLEKENEALLQTDFPYSYVGLGEAFIFIGDYDSARGILEKIIRGTNEEDFPYSYATAYALLGYIASKRGGDEVEKYFNVMRRIVSNRKYTNLDICNPELLKEITELSSCRVCDSFPRLHDLQDIQQEVKSRYPMEIRALGGFKVYLNGNEIDEALLSGQRRVVDLLKLLIVNRNKVVMKERIYEMFWPGYSYKSARDNLNTIIYRLRKILGDGVNFLETDTNAIRFKEDTVITDVDMFIDFTKRAKLAMEKGDYVSASRFYTEAVSLYRGDFIESDLYNDFIRDERENLRNLYKNALFNLTKIYLGSGEYLKALEWAKKLIEADSLCESGYRLLMIAASLVGNRSEIPRIFDKLNNKLQSYYKISADKRTVDLKNKLLSGVTPDESMWQDETII